MSDTGQGAIGTMKVAPWRIWGLRIIFAAMVIVLGSKQWSHILAGTSDWPAWEGLGRTMLATLATLAVIGVFRPLKVLLLMIYEMSWKILWLMAIALPAWLDGRTVPSIVNVTATCIGMAILTILIPWHFVWSHYIAGRAEVAER